MSYLLCRNRVMDFNKWQTIFFNQPEIQKEVGLTLLKMWREQDDLNNVFFLFEAADREKAEAFMKTPEAAKTGNESGVIEGECYFLDEVLF